MIRNCTCKLGLQGLSPIFSASCSKMYLCFASVAAGVYLLRECYLAFNSCSKSSVCRSNLACISPSPIIPLSPLNHITPIVINYTHNESHDTPTMYNFELCSEAIFGNLGVFKSCQKWQLLKTKVAIFGNFWKQKLPKMATLPRKFCRFWQPLCNARFSFQIWQCIKLPKLAKLAS